MRSGHDLPSVIIGVGKTIANGFRNVLNKCVQVQGPAQRTCNSQTQRRPPYRDFYVLKQSISRCRRSDVSKKKHQVPSKSLLLSFSDSIHLLYRLTWKGSTERCSFLQDL